MALRDCVFSGELIIKCQATSVTLMMELNWGGHTGTCRLTRRLKTDQKEVCIIQQWPQSVDTGHCGSYATPYVQGGTSSWNGTKCVCHLLVFCLFPCCYETSFPFGNCSFIAYSLGETVRQDPWIKLMGRSSKANQTHSEFKSRVEGYVDPL